MAQPRQVASAQYPNQAAVATSCSTNKNRLLEELLKSQLAAQNAQFDLGMNPYASNELPLDFVKTSMMASLNEPPTMWPSFLAGYRRRHKVMDPNNAAHYQPGHHLNLTPAQALVAALSDNTKAANPILAQHQNTAARATFQGHEVALKLSTQGQPSRKRRFNTNECEKHEVGRLVSYQAGIATPFNGRRNTVPHRR